MQRSVIVMSTLALAACVGSAAASKVGVSSWDDAAVQAKEKELPVLLELGTEW